VRARDPRGKRGLAMACESMVKPGQTLAGRMAEVKQALARLEQALTGGRVKVGIGSNGAIVFQGWTVTDRDGVSDVCAYRSLSAGNSWALRQAVARAEAASGRKVNAGAVAAGHHSHDGGHTWGKH
jgi:hypothetical protein